ncbi:hypothetical protein G6M26_50865 [Agrobacterium tumefaciens]|nr:hypothetical protein [Agrobacterium tumefaciens]NTE26852.1 hypothetical protein [Agrobacterium tumefaciens]
MNDPIKDFVEKHREDFDHLDAPQLNLTTLKARLAQANDQKRHKLLSVKSTWWMAAAAILLLCAVGFWFFKQVNQTVNHEQHFADTQDTLHKQMPQKTKAQSMPDQNPLVVKYVATPVKKNRHRKTFRSADQLNQLLKQLNDSTSSSSRLAAILTIKKKELISYDMLNRLSGTIEHDGNSNVRLAALSVLEKYKEDAYVSNLLVTSFNHQDDPMVQLVLVNLLGKMPNVQIDEKLYALVNDPSTLGVVKDEAYHILLKENKL